MRGLTTNEERVKELYATLEAKLDAYNTILGKQKYLAGDQITLADLFHLPYGFMLGQAGYDIMTQKPNVARLVFHLLFKLWSTRVTIAIFMLIIDGSLIMQVVE